MRGGPSTYPVTAYRRRRFVSKRLKPSSTNGTLIQLFDCNGSGAQQWRWRNPSRLVNPQSRRCLDATAGMYFK